MQDDAQKAMIEPLWSLITSNHSDSDLGIFPTRYALDSHGITLPAKYVLAQSTSTTRNLILPALQPWCWWHIRTFGVKVSVDYLASQA